MVIEGFEHAPGRPPVTVDLGVPPAHITPTDARILTDRIKVGVEAIWQLIEQAYVTRAWSVLGYTSWDDYCTREFGTSRLRLPREERQEVVASMREVGLSTRAIASAIGIDAKTVRNDLAITGAEKSSPATPPAQKEPVSPPATTTGIDGKTYSSTVPTAARKPTRKNVNVRAVVSSALIDIAAGRRALEALTRTQLSTQDEEARSSWAANLSESIEALTGFMNTLQKD